MQEHRFEAVIVRAKAQAQAEGISAQTPRAARTRRSNDL